MVEDEDNGPLQDQSQVPDIGELLKKCSGLLSELEAFHSFLKERKREQNVELRHFRNSILAEQRLLEKVIVPNFLPKKVQC